MGESEFLEEDHGAGVVADFEGFYLGGGGGGEEGEEEKEHDIEGNSRHFWREKVSVRIVIL